MRLTALLILTSRGQLQAHTRCCNASDEGAVVRRCRGWQHHDLSAARARSGDACGENVVNSAAAALIQHITGIRRRPARDDAGIQGPEAALLDECCVMSISRIRVP